MSFHVYHNIICVRISECKYCKKAIFNKEFFNFIILRQTEMSFTELCKCETFILIIYKSKKEFTAVQCVNMKL